MTGPMRLALALLPLAGYFFVLGRWHSGRRPKVVSGPLDLGLLAFGLGGLIAFGPVGEFVVNRVFPRPTVSAWLAMASLVGLLSLIAAARARRRIVVYHIEIDSLTDAIGRAMEDLVGPTRRTLNGFEGVKIPTAVTVEMGRRLGCAIVEAHGDRPEILAESLAPLLAANLSGARGPATRLATLWFGLACGTMIVLGVTTTLMVRPLARGAVQTVGGKD